MQTVGSFDTSIFRGERMRKLTIALIGACLIVAALALHYALPSVSVVKVIGVEVKRMDAEVGTRDVYIIQTQLIDGGAVRVFRNEDAWLYLKLDSASLQGRATAFARDAAVEAVAIRHYGWRIPVLSMFPNAIDAWPVAPDYRHIPVFNIAILTLLLAGALLAWRAVKRASARVALARERRAEEQARAAAARRSPPPVVDASHEDWLLQDRPAPGPSDTSGRDK